MTPDRIHDFIDRLAACTSTPGQGVTRFSYSPADREARAVVVAELAALGLPNWTDWAGNLHSLLAGRNPELPSLIVGSHLDSVRRGGRFDGAVGVAGALAVLSRTLGSGAQPERNIHFIAFAEEEGSNFGLPLLGSKAFTGKITSRDLHDIRNAEGMSAGEIFTAFGLGENPTPAWLAASRPGSMLELHVEQSGVLSATGVGLGVVAVIVGHYAVEVGVEGRAGHSGSSPMSGRRDALAGAAEMILVCENLANGNGGEGAVLTVGRIGNCPNAFNCIPETVKFSVDLRHPDSAAIDRVLNRLRQALEEIAGRRKLSCAIEATFTPGAALSPALREIIAGTAVERGMACSMIPSWAMHDAASLARQMPAGMIFVPSRGGLSHHPDEYTEPADIERGIALLCAVAGKVAGGGVSPAGVKPCTIC